tara:strand:- start:56 stop:1576 length:1521 start_codon:yes stop_codon:yes gene_type:complete
MPALTQIGTSGIKDNAITTAKIVDANVTTAKVADNAVTTAKITNANVTDAKLAATLNLSSKTVSVPAATVTVHSPPADLSTVSQDLALVAFEQIRADNRSLLNLPNSFVDQFEDSTGIATLTTAERDSAEYVASYTYGSRNFKDLEIQLLPNDAGTVQSTWDTTNLYSQNWTGDSLYKASNNYTAGIVNYLFDLAKPFNFNVYSHVSKQTGNINAQNYQAFSAFITTDTSVAGGKNPQVGGNPVFVTKGSIDDANYGQLTPDNMATYLNSGYASTINLTNAQYGLNQNTSGAGSVTYNAGDANFAFNSYASGSAWTTMGFRVVNNPDTDTLTVHHLSTSDPTTVRTDVNNFTINNVPHAGRFAFFFGEGANYSINSEHFSLSSSNNNANGTQSVVTEGIENATGSVLSVAKTASSSVTKMSIVVLYKDQAGTNALNTDLVAQVSADNGSNFTNATLVAAPNLTSDTKVAKSAQVTVTAGTQVRYKINFANQASNKQVRVLGVALLY